MTESPKRHRTGILGGTFDPIHIGHLFIAEVAREHLQLDEVRFIPAATAPHKQDQRTTAPKERLEMVHLATGGNPYFRVDPREVNRGGTSYTVDTLQELQAELPQSDLVFLMGADSLAELHTWRTPARICQLAFVAVLARGGHPAPDLELLRPYLPGDRPADLSAHLVPLPQIEISSSEIRARVAAGKSIRYHVHPAVAAFIDCGQLYRAERRAADGVEDPAQR